MNLTSNSEFKFYKQYRINSPCKSHTRKNYLTFPEIHKIYVTSSTLFKIFYKICLLSNFVNRSSRASRRQRCTRHRIEEIAETQKVRERLLLLQFVYAKYRRNKERAEVSRRFSGISEFLNSEEEKSVARATKLTAPTLFTRTQPVIVCEWLACPI